MRNLRFNILVMELNLNLSEVLWGGGTSTEMNSHEYFHDNLENDIDYYRLKQIDFDVQS